MVSISSASEITKRTRNFIQEHFDIKTFDEAQLVGLKTFLKEEYDSIPEEERIGKGMMYIVKIIAKELYDHIKFHAFNLSKKDQPTSELLNTVLQFINKLEADPETLRLAIHMTANLALDSFENTIDKIEKWVLHEEWEIQENVLHPVMSGLLKNKDLTLAKLKDWAISENENLRRLVGESLRPKTEIRWLRDATKNDVVLEILTLLNHDKSVFVRKSVGNNLKDLTKYMPEKILDLIEKWLADKEKFDSNGQKNLLWTIYHALRWLKDKKPEFHDRIKKLIGENYLFYFDEKRNRRALPPKRIYN